MNERTLDMTTENARALRHARTFAFPPDGPFVSPNESPPDGFVEVGWDQNARFPAYRVGGNDGELVPFTPLAQFAPRDFAGDFYLDAFTDAAIKARWREARKDAATRERIMARLSRNPVPHQFRVTGVLDPRGRIDAHGDVDLRAIRRPAFFAANPWREEIAEFDGRCSVVEIEAPREPYETLRMGLRDPIKLRGWHFAGDGVSDAGGDRVKALVVLVAGRSIETTAIHHPDDFPCLWSDDLQAWLATSYPNADGRTEGFGGRAWRTYVAAFVKAGFDVLTLDKRGHGISGGATDSNCNEQAEDIFRALDALETGRGARILTPSGELLEGASAAGRLLAGRSAREIPVAVSGASQGCMVACWAMHKNCVGSCDFDRPDPAKRDPYGYNLKAALLMAPFGGGLGYRPPEDSLVEAARREEFNVQMMPSSEVLAGVARWPALFIGRGLWDFSESLEGSLACFRRARGPRMILAVRASHGEGEWGAANTRHMQAQMTGFAAAALFGRGVEGWAEPTSVRDIVAAAPASWSEWAKPKG